MKVSVIVPVYTTETYLEKWLDSIINQDFNDYEIIIINDGSTDDSNKIINKYVEKYSNIKAFNKQNGGLSSARNLGIEKANGKYLMFVDSDDYIEPNMCEIMINTIKKYNVDIVRCNYRFINNKIVEDNINSISCNKILKKVLLKIII